MGIESRFDKIEKEKEEISKNLEDIYGSREVTYTEMVSFMLYKIAETKVLFDEKIEEYRERIAYLENRR